MDLPSHSGLYRIKRTCIHCLLALSLSNTNFLFYNAITPADAQKCGSGVQGKKEKECDGMLTHLLCIAHCAVLWIEHVAFCDVHFHLVVIADFIQDFLGKTCNRDVLLSLLRELGAIMHHLVPSFLSQTELSGALQAMVKEHQISWFQFARCLLRLETTRPHIFDFAKYTQGESLNCENYTTSMHCLKFSLSLICVVYIGNVFMQVLERHLGKYWYQLAIAMKLWKGEIDVIQQAPIDLQGKINIFLEKYEFPSFENPQETAEFLVEALERASLPVIAADVKRDMEYALNIEGDPFLHHPTLSFHTA